MGRKIVLLAGPTASGKSRLALELARMARATIINADSVQLYQGMPLLSAQPSGEDREVAEHRLYGVLSPYENGNVFQWLQLAEREIRRALGLGKLAVVVGGTGLYLARLLDGLRPDLPETDPALRDELNALYGQIGWDRFADIVRNVDPESVSKVVPGNRQRLLRIYEVYRLSGRRMSELEKLPNRPVLERSEIFLVNILPPRDVVYERCALRFRSIVDKALAEVKHFLRVYPDSSSYSAALGHTIGFREMADYLQGKLSYGEMVELAIRNTRNFAKRQYTWFRNQFSSVDYTLEDVPGEKNVVALASEIISRL
ncbi:MAG: tRNA (adenosine(37)-N6)-dimethylallyltransferase MiaA [Rickettsiales bacterium]|jgi:tRNA dimethylallyltransferase|nr:tRNA (adenosine(37)-N6)-dimethylallyltransferase MiaA [Rickettsiales bacterium]